jgi:hypothetical protein
MGLIRWTVARLGPMDPFPLPGAAPAVVVAPAPGPGPHSWAGAPSAALDDDGGLVIAYRLRIGGQDVARTLIAHAPDGGRFTTVATLDRERFGAFSMERPALVRTGDGRWRLYVSCASPAWPESKHWWIEVLEADTPAGLATAGSRVVFPGDDATAVKDPVVRRTDDGWEAWICCHPLDVRDEEDRMTTAYATSADGLVWDWHGTVLRPRPGTWDARGTRVTAVLPDGRAAYDGRASKEENFSERTGLAGPGGDGVLTQLDAEPVGVRYLDVLPLPDGGYRLTYEAPLPDGSHELRTELHPPD